jgi:simple sugar transport system ATP-binding protein
MEYVLEGRKLTKQFPGVLANDHIDFHLKPGEVHAILGENGAGKTTLMNIFFGLQLPDSGETIIQGKRVILTHPAIAIAHGIGMVHQNFMLIPHLTVTENIVLGREPTKQGTWLDLGNASKQIAELSKRYGMAINPSAQIDNLSLGFRQRIEILKALYREADILILDEPTSILAPQEIKELFSTMRSLAAKGKSVIFITHKLKEVFEVADQITVLRNGKVIGEVTPKATNESELAEMMVGHEVLLHIDKSPKKAGEIVLKVNQLQVKNDKGIIAVDNINLEIAQGEILGIAGIEGNGQSELAEALVGLRPIEGGEVKLNNHTISGESLRHIREMGVGIIPEDRQKQGLVLEFPVSSNLILNHYYQQPYNSGLYLRSKMISTFSQQLVDRFDIRTPGLEVPASKLSGGNQQKIIIARELEDQLRLLIASQPTRGVDVAAVEFIYHQLLAVRDLGIAILLISADLDELMVLSDRIAVMFQGKIMDTLSSSKASKSKLGQLMLGINHGAIASHGRKEETGGR